MKRLLCLLIVVLALRFCLPPLVAEIIKEHDQVEQKCRILSIKYYTPYLPYFSGIVVGIEKPKKELIDTYYLGRPYIFHLYYQKSVEMFPENDEAHYLLGFCEYYLGNLEAARAQYEKAVELNPNFFWSYYNLALIYFQQGDFSKSAGIVIRAFSLKNDVTLEILHQGPFYWQIWQYIANPPQVVKSNLNEAREDAMFLLADCFVKAGKFDQTLRIIRARGQSSTRHQELWIGLYKKVINGQRATGDIDRLVQEQIPVRLF